MTLKLITKAQLLAANAEAGRLHFSARLRDEPLIARLPDSTLIKVESLLPHADWDEDRYRVRLHLPGVVDEVLDMTAKSYLTLPNANAR
jgi:hypothetical protein